MSEEKIATKLVKIIRTKIVIHEHIRNKIKLKNENMPTEKIIIPIEHDITNWTTFLPPLQSLKDMPRVRQLGSGFKASLESNIGKASKEQFEQIYEVLGKIRSFSFKIQESIQNVVSNYDPILASMSHEPFLENVCCNEGDKNVCKYFIEHDGDIGTWNSYVNELNNIYIGYKNKSKPFILYDPEDTHMIYPPIKEKYTEETIYKAFIYYCNFNSNIELPEDLLKICISNESSIINDDTFEEKVQKLKAEGKVFNKDHLIELLNIVGRQNYIEAETIDESVHSHQELIQCLNFLKDQTDQTIIPEKLIKCLLDLTDSFDVYDWAERHNTETDVVDNLRNYLILANRMMKTDIWSFLDEGSSLKRREKEKLKLFLDTLTEWDSRGNEFYMGKDDETAFFIFSFLKQATEDISFIYPSIIINSVDYKQIPIPKHWNVKERHSYDIQSIIMKEFENPRKKINFSSFYNSEITKLLEHVKGKSKHLLLLMKKTPFFSKINNEDTIFDCTVLKDIAEFYFLTALTQYIKDDGDSLEIEDDIKQAQMDQALSMSEIDDDFVSVDSVRTKALGLNIKTELIDGEIESKKRIVGDLLSSYIKILIERKEMLNYNEVSIQENVLKAKIKETGIITKNYKDLSDDLRKVQKVHQNLMLGQWKLSVTKGVHQYSSEEYDKERAIIIQQASLDQGSEHRDNITDQLREIISFDELHENIMDSRRQDEIREEMDQLGDDDDFGNNDSDVRF